MNDFFVVIGVLVVIVLLLMIGPWLFLLSINTLLHAGGFAATIPFTFKTWLASLFLLSLFIHSKDN